MAENKTPSKQIAARAATAWQTRMARIEQEDPEAFEMFTDLSEKDQWEFYVSYCAGYMQAMIDIMGPHLEWEVQ